VYALRPELRHEDDPCLEPDSPYGYAKWVAELWCRMISQTYGLPTTVLRFFSVYGPGQQPNGGSGVVTIFARAALADQPLRVQSEGRRDFTDARDAALGIRLAIERNRTGDLYRVYNIATGVGTTFGALAELIREVAGSNSPIDASAPTEPPGRDLVADVRRAEAELGFRACVPLRAGLERYVEWLRQAG
jgi:nucleoside-diphosphate-sugar epimerase